MGVGVGAVGNDEIDYTQIVKETSRTALIYAAANEVRRRRVWAVWWNRRWASETLSSAASADTASCVLRHTPGKSAALTRVVMEWLLTTKLANNSQPIDLPLGLLFP